MELRPVSRSLSAVVLAAGASNRFGGFPKACLSIGQETAVHRVVRICRERGLDPVVVVTGLHDPEIRRSLTGGGAHLVRNERWAEGRTGSVVAGLEAVGPDRDVLIWPVDHPFVEPSTVERLDVGRDHDALALWFVPMYLGRSGHPILLRAEALRAVRELAPAAPLRQLITAFGPQVRRIPVGDPGVVANVDDRTSFQYALEQWRQSRSDT